MNRIETSDQGVSCHLGPGSQKEDGGKTSWQESHPPCFHLCLFSLLPLNIEAAVYPCVGVCGFRCLKAGYVRQGDTQAHGGFPWLQREFFFIWSTDFSTTVSITNLIYTQPPLTLLSLPVPVLPAFISALLSFCLFCSVAVSRYGRHGRVQLHRQ